MKNDGGQAFPVGGFAYRDEGFEPPVGGMTLRDYFAAKAMQAALTNDAVLARLGKRVSGDLENGYKQLAEGSYGLADAMLAERNK